MDDGHGELDNCARLLRSPARQLWWAQRRAAAVPDMLWQNCRELEQRGIHGRLILQEADRPGGAD